MIYKELTDLIGNTPIISLSHFQKKHSPGITLLAKLEYFNPAGSVKDRVALAMIKDAEDRGILTPHTVIIEPTSGNTGIGLAAVAAARRYQVILTMPETMSRERMSLLRAYGAQLVLTDGAKGMQGAIDKAHELCAQTPNAWMPGQFDNPANPRIHFETTGPEIWQATDGRIDIFVATVGTGGTLSGTGKYLKSQKPKIQVIGVEPTSSAVLSGHAPAPHKIQGIGAGFVPQNLDPGVYDAVITVSNEDAYSMTRQIAKEEGLLVGISSGACLYAAVQISKQAENIGKTIVALLPDSGERYLSTSGLFE